MTMTTKVTVDAHAGWPVQVTRIDTTEDGTEIVNPSSDVVPANEKRDFSVWQGSDLRIKEMPNT